MSRADHIREVLDEHFMHKLHIASSSPAPEVWRDIMDELGPQAQFGWSWPLPNDVGLLMPFCPEIIDEQTAYLLDEELEDYLRIIKWVGQTHILWWKETPDPHERQRRIEDELWQHFPVSLEIWSRVQLVVLDHQA